MGLFSRHLKKEFKEKDEIITIKKTNAKKLNLKKKVIELSKVKKRKEIEAKRDIKKDTRNKKLKTLKLIEDWKDIMYQTGTYTQDNKTFTFTNIKYEKFGFKAYLYCPIGLTFKTLDTIRDKIEDGLNCIFIYNKERLDNYMDIRIVTELSTNKEFCPPKTDPWSIYIGDKFDGTPIIVDLNKWCQVLLSGTTGGGKSKLLDCAIATQVYNHTSKDLWIFLIQLDKCDLLLYKDAETCKGFADDLDKAISILEYLMEENKKRTQLVASIKQKGLGSNITDYNTLYLENKQPTIWVVLDEMASISEKSSDSSTIKDKKQKVDDLLSAVSQYGRSNNIFQISCLQRPTANLVSSFIKSMANLKISFRQSNQKSSEVSMDDSSIALDLPQRVAVYKLLSYDFLQTPFITDPIIMKYIKPKLNPYHDNIFNEKERLKKSLESENDKKEEDNGTGKQDISYEQQLKQKEQEIFEREKELNKQNEILAKEVRRQNEELKKQNEILEQKLIKFKLQREEQHSDAFDKIESNKVIDVKLITNEEEFINIVEENKKNIEGWVEWNPPPQLGKEKVIK